MHNTRTMTNSQHRNIIIYITIWLLASIGGGLFFYNIYNSLVIKEANIAKEIATREILSLNSFCHSIFTSTENNLRLVSKGQYLANFINTMQPYQIEDTDRSERKDLIQFLSQLLEANPRYNSIRFISVAGRERIKVENTDKGPIIVKPEDLQNISHNYYVSACLATAKGSIYYSNIDLQFSKNTIEFPYKPTLRIGTSIYNKNGTLKGMILINLGINFSFPSHISLLNKNGDWVIGGGENWMNYIFSRIDNFATLHPKAWKDINSKEFGSSVDNETSYEFTTLIAPSSENDIYWKIVSDQPRIGAIGSNSMVDFKPILFLFFIYEVVLISILIISFRRQTKLFAYQKIIETNLEHYDISLKAGHAMSWIYTPNTRKCTCSRHVEDLIGIPPENICTEKDFIDLFQKPSSNRVKDFFDFLNSKEFDESQNDISIEHKVTLPPLSRKKSHKTIWLKTFAIRLKDSEDCNKIYGISFDITNRVVLEQSSINSRKASEQLSLELQNLLDESERLRIKAEEASSAKADFLANMSHEIRTPMNSVLGMVSLLQETDLTDEQKEYTSAVKYSGEALLMIINDILDHSKIESGKLDIAEVPFNLSHTIEHIIDMIKPQAEGNAVELSYEISKEVPNSLVGDDLRITQVLLNLGGNAVKFTNNGSVHFAVKVLEETEAISTVEIKVTDTGIGIEREALEEIFDKFTQADESITRKFGGTGLGLAICKSLVELMRGSISVESQTGVSTTFTIILPLKKHCIIDPTLEQEVENSSEYTTENIDSIRFPDARILLCEDNEMNQNLCLKFLHKFDATADIAENGLVAIDKFTNNDYDLILMDLQMPELDGISASIKIREIEEKDKRPHIPIIAITANVFEEDKLACKEAGMNGFLSKPVSLKDFKNTLHAFMPEELQEVIVLKDTSASSDTESNHNDSNPEPKARANEPETSLESSASLDAIDFDMGISNSSGEENFKNMIAIFNEEAPKVVGNLFSSASSDKHIDATRHAHTLKSMAGIIGASKLNKLCFDAEHCQNCEDILSIYPTLKEHAEIAIQELTHYLSGGISIPDKSSTTAPTMHIDRDAGIENSGCKENFIDMLQIFKKEAMGMVQNIDFESLNGDTKTTFIHINTLKSMANIIGAVTLSNICIEAEGAKDCDVVQRIIPIISESVEAVLENIEEINKTN